MRLLKQALAILGALVVLAVIVAFVAPKRTQALVAALVQIVPGTTTHIGQNESRVVWLQCNTATSYCSSVDSEANVSNAAYVVPSGYTLMVTDYEWVIPCGEAGSLSFDKLFNAATFSSALSPASGALSDNRGVAYGHEHYSTGIRIGSGVTVADFFATGVVCGASADLQGYLVPND